MKILHLEIDSCSDCPYCYQHGHEIGQERVDCINVSPFQSLLNEPYVSTGRFENIRRFNSVPDWCPLENKE